MIIIWRNHVCDTVTRKLGTTVGYVVNAPIIYRVAQKSKPLLNYQ